MSRPSWNEIQLRAADFAKRWKDDWYEKGEAQTFYNEFFEVFGRRRRDVGLFEEFVKKLNDEGGYIDLFWPNTLIAEHKSLGGDLEKAHKQAIDYCSGVSTDERPRYILTCDFQNFVLHDLSKRETARFKLAELPSHVQSFDFMLGLQERVYRDQDPANVRACELVGKLHDELEASGYRGHDLERYLVRIVFCLFADDTGIFDRDIFLFFIKTRTQPDGLDTGPLLNRLFQTLNTPVENRSANLHDDLARFPYINGDLFAEALPSPDFNPDMRNKLLDVCKFDWSNISPAIFGTMFQSVMDPTERSILGGHYTIEKNILKVIEPLFLDDLREEFERLVNRKDTRRRADLRKFQEKLGSLRFFDPACGCGNFLVIAYRELRELEIQVIRAIRANTSKEDQQELDVATLSMVDVDQFYGIEIKEFPCRIAEAAMWMMDHIMNNRLSNEFGQTYARIPLLTSPTIRQGDALETDWTDLLPAAECSYVLGNPPFLGSNKEQRTEAQRAQVRRIAALRVGSGTLDYVAAWFIKAGEYVQESNAKIGLVATNSITQGQQVGYLWPILFDRFNLEISFAHRTFAWESNAPGQAHVHVVILGLDRYDQARDEKRLFDYRDIKGNPEETQHRVLSPYLFGADRLSNPRLVARKKSRPANGFPQLKTGVQMIDNGILTFTQEEYEEFIGREPGSSKFFRKYMGGKEFINGFHRWVLYLAEARPSELRALPAVRERMRQVSEYRASRSRPGTAAMDSTKVGVDKRLSRPYLVIPNTSSERREYIPMGWLTPTVIANQKLRILPNATLVDFALLTSTMHMAWMRAVTGRMKSDYMYSVQVVYNTFPTPPGYAAGELILNQLEPLAQAILDARAEDPDATLADLYDPVLMPSTLRKAHKALDAAVDRLYRKEGFKSERERLEHLFGLYEQIADR